MILQKQPTDPAEDLLSDITDEKEEGSNVFDPFNLFYQQIHAVVNKRSPHHQYPTYEEDAARGLDIERTRRTFMREALRAPFILRKIAHVLRRVHKHTEQTKKGRPLDDSRLNFDRYMRTSSTEGITEASAMQDEFTEEAIKKRMRDTVPQLLSLIAQDDIDRRTLLQKTTSVIDCTSLQEIILQRENKMIDLTYAMPVRIDRILMPLLKLFREKTEHREVVQSRIAALQKNQEQHIQEVTQLQEEHVKLCEELLQTPNQLCHTMTEVNRAHQEYAQALHALVEPHLRLLIRYAKKYKGLAWDKADYIGEGSVGLLHAAELYEHRLRCKFPTYAEYRIRQNIMRAHAAIHQTIFVPEYVSMPLKGHLQTFYEQHQHLPSDTNADDLAKLSKITGISEEIIRCTLALQRNRSLQSFVRSHKNKKEELGDAFPDHSQPSPVQTAIDREIENYVHDVLRTVPIFHRIMFKLRKGLRLRDYDLPGTVEHNIDGTKIPGTAKIFHERTLTRILIKMRNGFSLIDKEKLIFQAYNFEGKNRKISLTSSLGPAEQLKDPPEGYLGSLKVESSKANRKSGSPAIVETVHIFDHGEKDHHKEAGYTLEVVGTICGVTRERPRQIEKKIMKKLQDPRHSERLKILLLPTDEQEEPERSGQE